MVRTCGGLDTAAPVLLDEKKSHHAAYLITESSAGRVATRYPEERIETSNLHVNYCFMVRDVCGLDTAATVRLNEKQ